MNHDQVSSKPLHIREKRFKRSHFDLRGGEGQCVGFLLGLAQ